MATYLPQSYLNLLLVQIGVDIYKNIVTLINMTNLQRIRKILDWSPNSSVLVGDVWCGRDEAMMILLDKELGVGSDTTPTPTRVPPVILTPS